jgi:UDP-N-acetyl-D-glucosamine dehydrogenase
VTLLNKINPAVHPVSSPRTAEMSKLLENIFRHVNIALINELALLAELTELDIWEVIEAASTKPFGFMPFYPGPGVGGHCIPVDPTYLSWKARAYDFTTKFIDLAAEANQRMPYHTVELIARALEEQHKGLRGAKVLLLGAAFKPNIDDARNSPTERVMTLLLNRRVEVSYYDPYIPRFEIRPNAFYRGHEILESVALDDELLREQDCVVILVRHRGVDYARLVEQASLVVDAVNATAGLAGASEKVVRLGVGQRMSPPHLNALQFAPMSQVDEVS